MPEWRRSATEWGEIVEAWLASGCSRAEYARRVGVNATTLGWWRWKLGVPAERPTASPSLPAFADVVVVRDRVADEVPDFVIEVQDLRVRVAPGFDAVELRRLLAAVC